MKSYKIYCLKDPDSNEIRYIGVTTNYLSSRLSQHIYELKKRSNTHKINWLKSLQEKGKKPIIELLENCSEKNWQTREKYWIKKLSNLTNFHEGGQGIIIDRKQDSIERSSKAKHKPVLQFTLSGEFVKSYSSIKEATITMKLKSTSAITNSIRKTGRSKACRGYLWIYGENYNDIDLVPYKNGKKLEVIYTDSEKKITFESETKASEYLHISQSLVSRICSGKRTSSKYKLRYKNYNDIV